MIMSRQEKHITCVCYMHDTVVSYTHSYTTPLTSLEMQHSWTCYIHDM